MARQRARKDWNEIRSAYRRGEGSLRELAKRFGVSASSVMKRAARDKWDAERQQTESKAQQKAAEKDVETLAAMLGKHRGLANLSLRLAELKLKKRIEEAEQDPEAVSDGELDALTKVVARMVPVERLAAGIERIKPVKPVEMIEDDEIVFDVDLPDESEAAPAAPAKT